MKCSVYNCENDNKKNYKALSYFKFPDDPKLMKKWLKFCRIEKAVKGAVVCMAHFKNEDIVGCLKYDLGYSTRRLLKPGVVPSIIEQYKDEKTLIREKTAKQRNNKIIVESLLKEAELSPPKEEPIEEKVIRNSLEDGPFSISLEPSEFAFPVDDLETQCAILLDDNIIKLNETKDCKEYTLESIEPQVAVATLNREIKSLKEENEDLKSQLERKNFLHKKEMERIQRWLDQAKFECTNLEAKLETIFTKGQIEKLKIGDRRHYWSEEDIAYSTIFYASSGRAYQTLLDNNFPFPSIRTLQNWKRKYCLTEANAVALTIGDATTTDTNSSPLPIYDECNYQELEDIEKIENISDDMMQEILEEDIGRRVDDLIQETLQEEEDLAGNNDVEMLNDSATDLIEEEAFHDFEVVFVNKI